MVTRHCHYNPSQLGSYLPTVLRSGGFNVLVFAPPREHPPAHVHVWKAGRTCVVTLNPVALVRNEMSRSDSREAVSLVDANVAYLLVTWRSLHG